MSVTLVCTIENTLALDVFDQGLIEKKRYNLKFELVERIVKIFLSSSQVDQFSSCSGDVQSN